MEGRHPPPKATHTFPDHVDFKRFFSHKETFYGFAKFATVFCSLWLGVLYTQYWISKDHPYVFGIKMRSPEELKRRYEAKKSSSQVKRKNYELFTTEMAFKMDRIFKEKPNVDGFFEDRSIEYEDDVIYYPGMVVKLEPVRQEKVETETKEQ